MILRDPVHGLISFEEDESRIVPRLLATKEVQRLRRIRQLGLTSLAFPGAEHTRFSHALGAAHVMQRFIARLRQVDEELPFWQRLTSDRAQDAIAAALLHDLGHGPFSHLFEVAMPDAPPHESWTERILLDPQAEVNRVLVSHDPNMPARVNNLVHGRHELPYLANAVSGTFDVDRCDYLLRDAHSTGVRYGEFDLPWLLRSLRLGASDGEPPGLAIDGMKGLSAMEDFLLARLFMFQQVYFHKSTRAAEWMICSILRRTLELVRNGVRLPALPRAIESVAAEASPSLDDYLELDDQVLLFAIHAWEESPDPILSDLCRRLRSRNLFKTLDLLNIDEEDGPEEAKQRALATARGIAAASGLDPDIYVGLDVAEDVPYAEDESLVVIFPQGRPRRPSQVSFLLDRLKNQPITKSRIIFAPELKAGIYEALIH